MAIFRLENPVNQHLLLPKGEFSVFGKLPGPPADTAAIRRQARERLQRFGIPFDWDRWESVTINPYVRKGEMVYLGVSGKTVVVEGQFYVNDVIEGDDCELSLGDEPFFCLHRNVFYTNDESLYRRAVRDCSQAPGPPPPHGFASHADWLLTAALYVLKKAGGGELTLEANRETGQRLLGDVNARTWVYEYWNVGDPEPATRTVLRSPAAAAEFLIHQRFIRLRIEPGTDQAACHLDGVLLEKLEVWLAHEKRPATLDELWRYRPALRQWAGLDEA